MHYEKYENMFDMYVECHYCSQYIIHYFSFPCSHFLASLQLQDSNVGDHDKSFNHCMLDSQPSKPNTN